ncbi:hypothetical protein RRU01S_07_01800 [Agrobacterium rubi TR3 = NBRC 13261]|uniref:DUF883 domain-containing protein n=1 Tax=Agrobacterium rubi TR3 = NBRC 13261 TaxID=1368415 RepID=A0A081CSK9_9HYPH|nr:hypothetical protein [Agrobacterium rubi]MBP1878830.1 hypothetical protein [Agrobacterium rubi]GAK69655.1 hypothetical protein RRU01S_07_01800 [Agrobacterium rubi TR3 = NBRC 13261]
MAFETPTHIDQEKRPDHPEGAIAANTEFDASDTQSVPDDAEIASSTPLVDEALEAVREQSDAEDPSAYASEEVEAVDSVSALTLTSGRVVKAEAKGVAATLGARIRAQPIAYLGLGAVVGYLLGRRF